VRSWVSYGRLTSASRPNDVSLEVANTPATTGQKECAQVHRYSCSESLKPVNLKTYAYLQGRLSSSRSGTSMVNLFSESTL